MQKKTKNDYDVMKGMLKTIRTLTESKSSNRTLNEIENFQSPSVDKAEENLKNDIIVINDVEVKLNSPDQADLVIQDSEKTSISQLIDNFKQQVSQIANLKPGITITETEIRFDGEIPDLEINFVLISGNQKSIKCKNIKASITNPLKTMFLLIQVEFAAPLFFAYFTPCAFLFLISSTNPITKWNTTPKIKTGCIINCTSQFVPIKCEASLNVSALKTDNKFMETCITKKNIRKKAESAMATFLPIEDLKNPLIFLKIFRYVQKYTSRTL